MFNLKAPVTVCALAGALLLTEAPQMSVFPGLAPNQGGVCRWGSTDEEPYDVIPRNGNVGIDNVRSIGTAEFRVKINGSYVGNIAFVTSGASISNSATETSLIGTALVGSTTIPTSAASGTHVWRFSAFGVLANTANPTLRIKLKLNSNIVCDTTAFTVNAAASAVPWRFQADVHLSGGLVTHTYSTFTYDSDGVGGYVVVVRDASVISGSYDGSVDQVVDLTAQWGTASSSNAIVSRIATLESLY